MINLKTIMSIFALLISITLFSASYEDLDRKIIKAYNSNPKNTIEVYVNSMLILEKASKVKSDEPWQRKAQKLITISCFYECTQAVDKKLYRQAYIWAKRGEKNGTSSGKVGTIPVKNFYDYLIFAALELEKTPMVKNSNPDELSLQIKNYNNDSIELMLQSLISRGAILRKQLDDSSFFLIEGLGFVLMPEALYEI